MKLKLLFISIVATSVILIKCTVIAATGTVGLKTNVSKIKIGEEFTVTLYATSDYGIKEINTKINYDVEKLELIGTELVDSENWNDIVENSNITLICDSEENIKNADIYNLYFRVKDNVDTGENLKIETSDIILDTNAQTDSRVLNSSQKIEIQVEKLKINFGDYNEVNRTSKKYLENVETDTTLEKLKNEIITNGNIQILKDNIEETNDEIKMATGMNLKIYLNLEIAEYAIVVEGDINGDGECDISDILQANKHRLNKEILLDEYFLAGDVNNDNAVNMIDILQINKFRLGKTKHLVKIGQYNYSHSGILKEEYSDSSINVKIELSEGVYITKIWVKDPSKQFKKVDQGNDWNKKLKRVETLMKGLDKAVVACNASGFSHDPNWKSQSIYGGDWDNAPWGNIVITNGVLRRKREEYSTETLLGIMPDGKLKFFKNDSYDSIINSGVSSTVKFEGRMHIENGIPKYNNSTDFGKYTMIGQVNSNNYIILVNNVKSGTSEEKNKTLDDMIRLGIKLNCKNLYRLDGGGSSTLWYRGSTYYYGQATGDYEEDDVQSASAYAKGPRPVADALYFSSLEAD